MTTEAKGQPLRALRFLARASWSERWLLLKAVVVTAVARIGVSLLPLPALTRRASAARPTGSGPGHEPETIAWAVDAAARVVPKSTCLVQAVAGQHLLQRYGHRSWIRIGVSRAEGEAMGAHAWVETEAGPLIGAEEAHLYAPLSASGAA